MRVFSSMAALSVLLLLCALSVISCGGSDGGPVADGDADDADVVETSGDSDPAETEAAQGDQDTAGETAAETEAAPEDETAAETDAEEAPTAADCSAFLPGDEVIFDPDPAGPDCQIHAEAAFDGAGVWVVYNVPDAASTFDVWALKLDCAGGSAVPPFKVNTTDFNDVDPTLAVTGGRLLAAWQSDDSSGPRNLNTYYRLFDQAGAALTPTAVRLSLSKAGTLMDVNAWMPKAAATAADTRSGERSVARATARKLIDPPT